LRRAEGGAKIFGVFRVKNYDFTPKNHIFTNCGERRDNFLGNSCEKSRFYAKNHIFSKFRGARAGCAPPLDPPLIYVINTVVKYYLNKIDTSFHQRLPNMDQRLFADVIHDAIWFMNIHEQNHP
jgi:hypothetical protein